MTDLVQANLGWHPMMYETTPVCTRLHAGGTPGADRGPACLRRLHLATLSNPPGQRAWAASGPDSAPAGVCHAERAQCHSCLPCPGAGLSPEPIPPPQTHPPDPRCAQARTIAGVVETALSIRMEFASFEDYWAPYAGQDGPGAEYVATLSEAERTRLREAVRF